MIKKLTKSWLYADLLEKPEEMALFRKTEQGGLGLVHVQRRALACLILNFLEIACSSKYTRNIYHEELFQTFVMRESEDDRSLPPYFKGDYFPTIRRIRRAGLNLEKVTLREIYRFL